MKKLISIFLASIGTSEAVIVFTDIPDVPMFSNGQRITRDIDLNGDGTDDVSVISDLSSMRVLTLNDNTSIATIQSPAPNLGGTNLAFDKGEIIGSSLFASAQWLNTSSGDRAGPSTLLACRDIGCIGDWGGQVNYVGVEITGDDGLDRYGWIEIDAPFVGAQGMFLRSFAFETDAEKEIIAGAIPEPTTLAFCVLACAGLFSRRR